MKESIQDICLHRYGDCVSMTITAPEGLPEYAAKGLPHAFVYLTAERARALAAGLLEAANNIENQPDFCTSHFGTRTFSAKDGARYE